MKFTFSNRIIGFMTTIMLIAVGTQVFAQTGCPDPNACNYSGAVIDDGSCLYYGYFIPLVVNAGPAILGCDTPDGYWFPDQDCVSSVIANDPYCLNTNWDSACQNAYNNCLGCAAPIWSIPFEIGLSAAVFDCTVPAGYQVADPECLAFAATIINYCTSYAWDNPCQNAYNACLLECSSAYWHIPFEENFGPAVYSCSTPSGYWRPTNQSCLQQIIANDPYCIETTWDTACQQAYNNCAFGCSTGAWQIPYELGVVPAVFACTPPVGYYTADQECFISAAYSDAFCFLVTYDLTCSSAYNLCSLGCTDATWYIPYELGSGPAIQACTAPAGYWEPDQSCVVAVLASEAYSNSNNWDSTSQSAYNECAFGCADAQWFIPYVPTALNSPAVLGCTPPEGYQYVANQACLQITLSVDYYCTQFSWEGLCNNYLYSCSTGCTYLNACNYNPLASIDDQSCLFPGCTDWTAANYNMNAFCDDGSCVYNTCPSDLNSDGTVNSSDLLEFLSSFATDCP